LSAVTNEIRVYPVPATSGITIELRNPAEKNLTLQIFTASGQLLSTKQIATPGRDEEFYISISHLPAGVYLLRFIAGDFILTRQIIKN
jgi:5-hydroxyisourate hydrolase-like protein (transthyretin family)